MRLCYLVYFHQALYIGAVFAAMFCGMVIQYNIKQAEHKALVEVYTEIGIRGLAEVSI